MGKSKDSDKATKVEHEIRGGDGHRRAARGADTALRGSLGLPRVLVMPSMALDSVRRAVVDSSAETGPSCW